MAITAHSLAKAATHLQIGDVIYLPALHRDQSEFRVFSETLRSATWFRRLVSRDLRQGVDTAPPLFLLEYLFHCYERARSPGWQPSGEPSWMWHLPDFVKANFRHRWLTDEGTEPWAIVGTIPFSGVDYFVVEEDLTEDVVRAFGLFRLGHIRQLGFLHGPTIRARGRIDIGTLFHHTRYCHSLDVMALATLMARNCGLPERDTIHLRVAALSHDALTPAGGDTTKLIDPEAFDEDAHFPKLLKGNEWEALRKRYGLSAELLSSIVRGEGYLGQLLDLADKIAYVSRDANHYLGRYDSRSMAWWSPDFQAIKSVVRERPLVCSVWDTVGIENENVVINDGDRFADFARLRARMFRGLYWYPAARFLEHMVARILVQYGYERGELTHGELLAWNDYQLGQWIDRVTERPYFVESVGLMSNPYTETFTRIEDARMREIELARRGKITLIESFSGTTGRATHYLVRDGVRVLPFGEAYSDVDAEIEQTLTGGRPIRLYFFSPENTDVTGSPRVKEALEWYRKKRLEDGTA